MGSLLLMAVCSAAIGASDGETYAEAHQLTMKTGKPMLVMVSTEWCPACQVMKRSIMPQVRQRKVFKRVAFASINPDQERELAQQITGGGPIPQLILYTKTTRGWTKRTMIGSQSVESVESFINQDIVTDDKEIKDDSAPKETKSDDVVKTTEKT